ncbi:MAG: ribonuclease R [Gammaproteobacteria bacterium]|nr:MAG: ribonuclease R [Gammaproteobacteria bacterium]
MKKHVEKDPFADREAAKYDRPIPSREYILDFLSESIGPLTYEELCSEFGIKDEDGREALRRRLIAMERDGQTVRNRRNAYGTLDKMNLIKGRVVGHPEGFGFVIPAQGGDDLFLSSRQMRRVMDGDEVLVRIAGWDRRGRPEGSIVDVVEHHTSTLVGRYFVESGIHFVRPDNPRVTQDILIPAEQRSEVEPGQIVVVEITTYPSRHNLPAGRVVQVLGDHLAPGMEIDIAIHNYGIPHEWPEAVVTEAAAIPEQVASEDTAHRVDLRQLPFVTIDGEDARDFDDAVYCEPRRNGWRLLVAIADVSHYVAVGSPLDREAYQRGNSVYFPQNVVPMLPEKLSNGLCSLNPHVDRLTMVCDMILDQSGNITKYQFYEGVIHSHGRLTYTQVASMIAQRGDKDSGVRKQFHALTKHVDHLHALYLMLLQSREVRGAIDFDSQETRILFDAERKIQQIIPSERTEAHRLIEECMLCANVCAASLLQKSKLPALYRVHEGPRQEKLADLREFLGELGLGLPGGDEPSPKDFQRVLLQVAGRPDAGVIQTVILRTMNQAVYDPDNNGHFGLNYPAYTHFTSPIRRYPDLLVHRAIRFLVRKKGRVSHVKKVEGAVSLNAAQIYPYDEGWMVGAGEHCSMTERRADEATRDVVNWLKCEYLLSRVGEEYDGVVVSVTGFGLFVQLSELFIEGLVHITGLPKDYYYHESAHHRLIGERTKRVFGLGDKLRVRVSRVDLDERKIDFDLVDEGRRKSKKGVAVSPKALEMAAEHEQQRARKQSRSKKKTSVSGEAARKTSSGGKPPGKRRRPATRKRK